MHTRSLRSARLMARRLLGAVMLALQIAAAVSWVAEPRTFQRLDTHAEDLGARHADMHDEATCPVCALRASFAAQAPAEYALARVEHRFPVTPWTAAGEPRVPWRAAQAIRAPPSPTA